jgi:glycosyltransferase involved in cell wall biosynthesis
LPSAKLRRAVVTFHDLFVMTGDYSSPEFRARFADQARQAAERADMVIAVSAFTAGHVEALLGVERSRIRVVHHGINPPPRTPGVFRKKVILNVGAIQRRKNIVRLVDAFEQTPADWKLVLAGSGGFQAAEIQARIDTSPRRADIDVTGYVTSDRLEELYASAAIFAFPSLDEGFGLPVLEAMARGVPVITSNRSAMPEVAGDAALLVNPDDTDALAHALNSVIENPADWAARGLSRASKFSWSKAARETHAVYHSLL